MRKSSNEGFRLFYLQHFILRISFNPNQWGLLRGLAAGAHYAPPCGRLKSYLWLKVCKIKKYESYCNAERNFMFKFGAKRDAHLFSSDAKSKPDYRELRHLAARGSGTFQTSRFKPHGHVYKGQYAAKRSRLRICDVRLSCCLKTNTWSRVIKKTKSAAYKPRI